MCPRDVPLRPEARPQSSLRDPRHLLASAEVAEGHRRKLTDILWLDGRGLRATAVSAKSPWRPRAPPRTLLGGERASEHSLPRANLISVRPAVQMVGNFPNHKPQSLLLESFLGVSFSPCVYHKPQRGSRPRCGHFAWKCFLLTRRLAPSARHPLPATRQAPPGLPWLPRALRDAPSTGSAASDFSRACVSAHVRSLHPGFPMRPRHPSSPPTVLPQIHLRILLQPHPTIRQRSRVPQAVCVYRVNAYVDHTHGSTSYIF